MRTEQRKTRRKPFDRRAWIDVGDELYLEECVLGNLSETGAKLIVNGCEDLPQFILRLSRDGRVARKCRLAWRSGNDVGVEFIARLVSAPERPRQAVER